ncbi:MAG: hypothetical protein WBQ94_17985 [Terracidiphilus sp.]
MRAVAACNPPYALKSISRIKQVEAENLVLKEQLSYHELQT